MNWNNKQPEFDSIEDYDIAIDFLFKGRPDIEILRRMFYINENSIWKILTYANVRMMEYEFDIYYKNFILKYLSLSGESVSIIDIEDSLYNLFVMSALESKNDILQNSKSLMIPSRVNFLRILNIKNERTLKFIEDIMSNQFRKENKNNIKIGGNIDISLLPLFGHETLNYFINRMCLII